MPIDDPGIKYSVVKPIMKFKGEKFQQIRIVKAEENYKFAEPEQETEKEFSMETEVVDVKFQDAEIEEVQEEEVYAVESIMDTDDNDNDNDDPENFFEETEITEIEVKHENLRTKLIEAAAETTFQCECGTLLPSLVELQKHMQSHKRKPSGNDICCGVGFKDFKAYTIHQKAHENFEAIAPHLNVFTCNDCSVMYSNQDDLNTHLDRHEEDFMIERRGAYEDHFLRNLPKELEVEDTGDLFICGHCRKKLNEADMKVHLLFFHTTNVYCPFDNRGFVGTKHVRLFSDHIRNKHPEIFEKNMLYSCRHCHKTFTTCFEKLSHMKLCTWKPFQCGEHCNKRFATEWLMKAHLKHVNGEERFSCETCGKRCVSRSDLQIHERMHTNERP